MDELERPGAIVRMPFRVYMDALEGAIAQRKANEVLTEVCFQLCSMLADQMTKAEKFERKLQTAEKKAEKLRDTIVKNELKEKK